MNTKNEQSGSLHEPGRPLAKDLRSEPAKARDEWLASAEGQKAADSATLVNCGDADYYLKNRLCRAFIAGMEAECRIQEGKRPTETELRDRLGVGKGQP